MITLPRSLAILFLAGSVCASAGDRAQDFRDCTALCRQTKCDASNEPLPLALRLTMWTCSDDCEYSCMHVATDLAEESDTPIQQYHGKWPFWRFIGMQEPASVLFSLLNLWAHVRGLKLIRRKIPASHPMVPFYVWWSVVNMNAWIWSAVFHTRDKQITEKLDYFSAGLAILYGLYMAVVRLFFLYPNLDGKRLTAASHYAPSSPARRPILRIWSIICILAYIAHISYLAFPPRFDYTYNIVFNLAIGLAHNFLWLLYALPSSLTIFRRFPSHAVGRTYRPAFASKAALFVILTTAATTLELFDFPPWRRTIDAHSLWHLSTAPIVQLWYKFMVQDALDDGWRMVKA
ncbi:Per1-like protein [Rickenella mellea]|uniref:Post-GPI attachment to proteins factor 3 n=1 Tax=Rickenella mellea TaxID=50990 RepID=A0A4Y7PXU2_9AGAM|nr:Per1-like protein [Rickenella mellea]